MRLVRDARAVGMTDELRRAAGYKFTDLSRRDPVTELGGAWWKAPEAEMHMHVTAVTRRIETDQAPRLGEMLRYARLYAQRNFQGFGSSQYQRAIATSPRNQNVLKLNVIKACISTSASKISKNRPRALFLTDGADYELQDRAEKCTQYVDGLFRATDVYTHGQAVFVDSQVFGTGGLEVFAEGETIKVERVFIDEIRVDAEDGKRGKPRQMHRVISAPRDGLLALYGKDPAKAEAIRNAPAVKLEPGSTTVADHVAVTRSWHLRTTEEADDGRFTVTIDGATLQCLPWRHDYFPILFLRWEPALSGFFGVGLCEELTPVQLAINRMLRRIDDGLEGAVPRTFLNGEAQVNRAAITDEVWSIINYSGVNPPVFSPTAAFPAEVYTFLWNLWNKAFEVSGVSQLSATGKKPAGLDSGVALREYQDIESERFVLAGQRWEAFFMEIARVMLDMTRDLAARNPKLSIKVVDGDVTNNLTWLKDVNLTEDQYLLQVWPTAGLPQSPAGRLAFVSELRKQGFLQSNEIALQLLNYPDLKKWISLENAGLKNVRKTIALILNKGIVSEPTEYMPLDMAIREAHAAYLDGLTNGRPRERLDLLETWIGQADALLKRLKAEAAPPAPAPGPGGPGMGPEAGAPPGAELGPAGPGAPPPGAVPMAA